MRKGLIFFLLSISLSVQAADLVTRDGKIYHDYKVLGHDAGYLTILYCDGGGKIPLSNLNDEMQKEYGYNKAQADAFVAASTEADRQARIAIENEQKAKAQHKDVALATISTAPVPSSRPTTPAPVSTNTSSSARSNPPALSQDDIDALNEKIKELKEDIRFMKKEEAKDNAVNPLTGQRTMNVTTGAYADKIEEESEELAKLQAQLAANK
jgi:hypothetical protein